MARGAEGSSEVRNQCAGPFGAAYDFYIERPRLMVAIGRLLWGIDASILYDSFKAIAAAADGSTIIDVPCGGGVAFRALRPAQDVRYLAGDLSEKMLARAAHRASERGLDQIELVRVDMLTLPFEDSSADLFACYSGLHMLEQPQLAIAEIVRCLKAGGRLVGTTFLREGSRRQRALFEIGQRSGHAQPPTYEDLSAWFAQAGLEAISIRPRAGFAMFEGRKLQR